MLVCPIHIFRAAMTNSDDNKPEILDVPAFLRDPQPSKPMKCPTLLVAWRRTKDAPPLEPGGEAGATDDTNKDRQ